jgi:N-acetylmuramoyl-L-alanine amidase CwlA
MPKCPFAVWKPFAGSPGGYAGGHPFKIVHHTTEGSNTDGAFDAYRNTNNIPHFTVDDMTIYQHVDTDQAAVR